MLDGIASKSTPPAFSYELSNKKDRNMKKRGLIWKGNIGGDPNNPFPLKLKPADNYTLRKTTKENHLDSAPKNWPVAWQNRYNALARAYERAFL